MRELLGILNKLWPADIDWLLSSGQETKVQANAVVVEEGSRPDALYVVVQGLLGVRVASLGQSTVLTLGAGEVVGEMSLIDDRPECATIFAVESSLLLAVPRAAIGAELEADPAFAARVYHSFASVVSGRLREGYGSFGRMLHGKAAVESAVQERWEGMARAVDDLKQLFEAADRAARRDSGEVPAGLQSDIRRHFHEFCLFINDQLGEGSPDSAAMKEELGARLRRELFPYILLAETAERMHTKPRGYAGDFLTIEMVYRNTPSGSGRIGPLIDRCFLDLVAAQAVRNRRGLLAGEIGQVVAARGGETARVTSLACGPAEELFDLYAALPDPSRLLSTLIDIDPQALTFVCDRRDRLNLGRFMTPIKANLVRLALGRRQLPLEEQDLVYSIGLIDYFGDRFVIALLDYIYEILRQGGKVILGNFHPRNPSRAFMDHVLDWRLIHRTEEDMDRLFLASRFKRPCTRVRFESEGINLFAECNKEP